ncbi:MAG: hypothetical protein GX847_12835, partial [Clostridiales bacterium]|nr:hypothetical protein [Clostridiales bacterium]
MIIASAVVAFLLLICFIRFGLIAVYGENGFELRVSIGPFKRRIFPTDKTRKKDDGKKKEQKAESAEKAGKLETLKNQLPSIKQALSRLKRRLLIKELTIHYMAAGDDPAAAALYF